MAESLCTIRSALSNLDNEEKRISTIGHYAAYLAGGSEFDSQVWSQILVPNSFLSEGIGEKQATH